MNLDRPAVDKTREALIKWVGDFLWHYEAACIGGSDEDMPEQDLATIIVNAVFGVCEANGEDHKKIEIDHLPNPAFFFQQNESQ